jgi:hypothetical protein
MIQSLLIDSCTVQRTTSGVNTMGARTITLAAAHLTGQPCRLDFLRRAREIAPNVQAEVGSPLLFMNDVDVQMGDTITVSAIGGETVKMNVISKAQARGFSVSHVEIIGKRIQ